MKYLIFIILIFSTAFYYCNNNNNLESSISDYTVPMTYNEEKSPYGDIKIELIQTIGSETNEDYLFSVLLDIEIDEDGNLYALDHSFKSIKVFNKEGIFIKEFKFTEGQGPGEFLKARNFTILDSENEICIYDLGTIRLSVFNKDNFKFKKSLLLKYPFSNRIYTLEDNRFLSVNFFYVMKKQTNTIHGFNIKGETLYSFGNPNEFNEQYDKSNLQHAMECYSTKTDSFLFISYGYPYDIRVYNINKRKLIKRIARITDFHGGIIKKGEFNFPTGKTVGIAAVSNSLIMNFVMNSNTEEIFLHAFDFNGRDRGTIDMTEHKIYEVMNACTTFKEKLYVFSMDPYPRIMIFKIIQK